MNFVHKWPANGRATGNGAPEGAAGPADGDPGVGAGGEALLTGLVLASLWWTTLCLGGYRPETMPVTVTLNAAAVIVWLGLEAWRRRGLRLRLPALAMLPFLVYAAVNAGWVTPVSWLGWLDWLGWAQMAAVFWVVLHGIRGARAREALLWGLVALGVVAVAMAAYQRLADPKWLMLGREQAGQFLERSSGPFGIPNSLAAFLNLLLPPMLALALQRGAGPVQRIFCGYLAALFACGVLLTVSRGAWLALGLALAAWPLLRRAQPAAALARQSGRVRRPRPDRRRGLPARAAGQGAGRPAGAQSGRDLPGSDVAGGVAPVSGQPAAGDRRRFLRRAFRTAPPGDVLGQSPVGAQRLPQHAERLWGGRVLAFVRRAGGLRLAGDAAPGSGRRGPG